jgi:hypothetical protein
MMRSRLSATEDVLQLTLEGREESPGLRLSSLREHSSQAKGHATDPEGFRTGGRYTLAFFGVP